MLSGVHLKATPIVRGNPTAERAEQKPSLGVLGNGHDRQIGQTVLEAKRIKPGAVEPADAAVGRGNPEKALAILVDVFDMHPSQPIKDRVLAAQHVLKGYVAHTLLPTIGRSRPLTHDPPLRYDRRQNQAGEYYFRLQTTKVSLYRLDRLSPVAGWTPRNISSANIAAPSADVYSNTHDQNPLSLHRQLLPQPNGRGLCPRPKIHSV